MKLTTFILIIALTQVSAKTYSQITLKERNTNVIEVLKQIEKQSGFVFLYDFKDLNATKVSISVKDVSVNDALKACFEDLPFTYTIGDTRTIIIKHKEKSILENIIVRFQSIDVRGIVLDEQNKPLPGVTVREKDTQNAVISDATGRYMITVKDKLSVLIISFIGYETQEISVSNVGNPAITALKVSMTNLKEVIVNKGYYDEKKELSTGSVGTLKAADIARQPVSDPLFALEGRVPGLYISQTSGVPGASIKVTLRGRNSIANGNDPLYIVDGIPFNSKSLSQTTSASGFGLSPFASIRADDIEGIEVLKDADATSIYGSRGANGVILITTKSGKAGKSKVDLNIYHGYSKATRFLDLMNTQQYLQMRNESLKNDNQTPQDFDSDINGAWDTTRYTNWQKLFIGKTSHVTDAKATISGGDLQTQFLIGFGYRNETTVYPGDFSNQVGSLNVNIKHESENKRLHLNFSSNFNINNNNLPTTDFAQYIFTAPDAPAIYDNKGQLNWQKDTFDNPFGALLQKSSSVTGNLINNFNIAYKLIDGLQIKSNFGYTSTNIDQVNVIPFSSMMPSLSSPNLRRSNISANNRLRNWIIEPQVNYSKSLKDNNFGFLLGGTFQESKQDGFLQSASGFASDALIDNTGAATRLNAYNNYTLYRYNAIYARLGYNYKEKYILNFTGRRDGSSRFGPGKQFGNFGSVGAAWLFSKEDWFHENLPLLSLGKLRGSIGKTGNDQLPDYQYLSTYFTVPGYFGSSGLQPTQLANASYGWETINKIEAALELGFFENRILLNASWYRNRTGNQLVGYSLPDITGFTRIQANLSAVIENKGLEFDFTTVNIKHDNLSWTSSFNISFPKNKLLSYPDIASSSYATQYFVGQPLSVSFYYKYTGIDPNTGLYTFKDLDNDGQLTNKDKIPVFVGQKYFGGLQNSFSYNGFSLDVFFQFVKQTGFGPVPTFSPGWPLYNQPVTVLERWQKPGDQAKVQKYATVFNDDAQSAYERHSGSDARIVDASFIRLKNLSFSWQLPKNLAGGLNLKNARIYVQGQNILTLTKFTGADPETQTLGLQPLSTLTLGLQVTL